MKDNRVPWKAIDFDGLLAAMEVSVFHGLNYVSFDDIVKLIFLGVKVLPWK